MGWCSATEIFDTVCENILDSSEDNAEWEKSVLLPLADVLRDHDWDCEQDSEYWDHPVVQAVFRELEPDWFEDEE